MYLCVVTFQWGDVTHEVMQTLGLWHTQQRPDRDDFVIFNPDNLQVNNPPELELKISFKLHVITYLS